LSTDPSVDALFAGWDLGAMMLRAVEHGRASGLYDLAAATARCFDPDSHPRDLAPLISAAVQAFLPIDNILDGEEAALAREAGPVRTALVCVATVGLIAEMSAELERDADTCISVLAILGRAFRDTAAGQDWDATNPGSETHYWHAVAGKLEAGGAAAASLGAVIAGAPADAAPAVRTIGRALGRIGQIEDDVLDVTSEPPAADWRRPQCNIVLLYGIAPGMPERDEMARAIANASDPAARERVRAKLRAAGAGAYLRHVVGLAAAEAWSALALLPLADRRPLAAAIEKRQAQIAALIGTPVQLPGRATALGSEPTLAWPLLEEHGPAVDAFRSGYIAGWARLAAASVGGAANAAEPALSVLAHLIAAIRIMDDWQDGDEGIYRQIGGGRTANLAVGLCGLALEKTAGLPLRGEAWRMATSAVGRGLALTLRGQDHDLTAPGDERGYWLVTDAKTPPLIEAALTLGALLGGADPQAARAIAGLARNIGRLLQIGDDWEDAFSTPPSADWRRPERNLLLLYAITAGDAGFRELARGVVDRQTHRAACKRLVPGAALYAAHALSVTLDALEAQIETLRLPNPEALQPTMARYRAFLRQIDLGRFAGNAA
jgi:geranylgeranyl pyrophosphate synthase